MDANYPDFTKKKLFFADFSVTMANLEQTTVNTHGVIEDVCVCVCVWGGGGELGSSSPPFRPQETKKA